jgi:hypothetical protein
VWSRRPDAGVKSCAGSKGLPRGDGGNQALAHQGEHGVSRSTNRAGKAGVFLRLHLWTSRPLRDFFARGPTGAGGHSAFPAPSHSKRGAITLKARTRSRREEGLLRSWLFDKETCWSPIIAWGDSDEAIDSVSAEGFLDCFAEPVIRPRFARTRWLAMTNLPRRPKA